MKPFWGDNFWWIRKSQAIGGTITRFYILFFLLRPFRPYFLSIHLSSHWKSLFYIIDFQPLHSECDNKWLNVQQHNKFSLAPEQSIHSSQVNRWKQNEISVDGISLIRPDVGEVLLISHHFLTVLTIANNWKIIEKLENFFDGVIRFWHCECFLFDQTY